MPEAQSMRLFAPATQQAPRASIMEMIFNMAWRQAIQRKLLPGPHQQRTGIAHNYARARGRVTLLLAYLASVLLLCTSSSCCEWRQWL
jgi:hypothetical protein